MTRTHNYTDSNRKWGHDYTYSPTHPEGLTGFMLGFGHGIEEGDYILLSNNGGTTRVRIVDITYKHDPSDMWQANVEFAPRYHED